MNNPILTKKCKGAFRIQTPVKAEIAKPSLQIQSWHSKSQSSMLTACSKKPSKTLGSQYGKTWQQNR